MGVKYLFDFGELMKETFEEEYFLWVFLGGGVLCMILLKGRRLEVLADIFFVMVAVVYLHFRKRGIGRVVNPIIFIGFVILLTRLLEHKIMLQKGKVFMAIRYVTVVTLLVVAIILPLRNHRSGYYWFLEREEQKTAKIVNHVRADKEHKYVSFVSFTSMRNIHFTRQEPVAENVISSVYVGWMVYTPYWYDLLEQHGIDQYKDCLYLSLTDPKIKMLCNSSGTIECLEKAIEETYGIQVQRRLGMIRDGRQIYQMWNLEQEK